MPEHASGPTAAHHLEGVDFEFFNSPAAYRKAAAEHARDGAFYSDRGDGFWVLTSYERICRAFKHEDEFSVSRVSAAPGSEDERWVPLTLEGGEHAEWRHLLGGWFTPHRIRGLAPTIRANARRRVEALARGTGASFPEDFARPYVIENLMVAVGWPVEDLDFLLRIDRAMITSRDEPDPHEAFHSEELGLPALKEYAREHVERRRHEPIGDLTSATLDWRINGGPITDADRVSLLCVLFLAGIDSTVNHMSNAMRYLACTPSNRARFVTDESTRANAVEEFLRVNSCMYPGRQAVQDNVCPAAQRGDTVLLPLSLANHDPTVFPEPDLVDFDRQGNRHIAFGTGAHQCLGAALARTQMSIGLEEWHTGLPDYRPAWDQSFDPKPFLRNDYDLKFVW